MKLHTVSFDHRPWTATAVRVVRRWVAAATFSLMLGAMLAPGAASAVEPWPHVDEPPKGGVQWVARSMIVNGIPTSVMQFQSPLTSTEMIDYYKSRWSSGYDHPPAVHHIGDATIVGQMHGSYLMTMKVSPAVEGGSRGLISVAQVLGTHVDRDPGVVPMIAGGHVVSVIESQDAGQHSRQVLIVTSQSAEAVADYYQSALSNAGWRPVQSNVSKPPGGTAAMGSFLAFSQEGTEMQLSIAGSKQGHTSVMANVISHATGDEP